MDFNRGGCLSLDSIEQYGIITKKTYLKIALCSVQAFLCDSSTAVTIVCVLWLLYMIDRVLHNPKLVETILSGRKIVILVAIGFTAIVFFTTKSDLLQSISAWFGKDITFNGRTAIWRIALQYITDHPLIGAGPVLTFDMGWGVNMTHAHCLYLNIFAHYGVFALILVITMVWSALKRTKAVPSAVYYTLFLYLIGSIIEVYSLNTLILLCVILGCYSNTVEKRYQ
ncbi:O-antigen ligase family protein [Sharpea azabuensis]|uniref:O-antigen ligase family protein n=1 Tax=Sharpea azabuensis TaxID=322505 RepID=UPI0023F56C2E|nr:O-antigen ligase family protein [Sharpea azabuensis]